MSFSAQIPFSIQRTMHDLGSVPHCVPTSLVRNLLPHIGCLVISAQLVGSCCSRPDCIVCQAFITPCHIGDPCLTSVLELMIQLGCAGHRPLLDCLVCATLYLTRTFQGSYPLDKPLINCLTRRADACHWGSIILTPPLTMGSTAVSHRTLALAQDSLFPDQI